MEVLIGIVFIALNGLALVSIMDRQFNRELLPPSDRRKRR